MTITTQLIESSISGAGIGAFGGRVMEASTGAVFAVYVDGGVLEVWDDVESSPTLGDSDTATTIFGAGVIGYVHACIDSSDLIHLVAACTSQQTRDVAYATYNISTSTIGTWEEVFSYTSAAPVNPGCAIGVDSSDIAVVLAVNNDKVHGTNYDRVTYTKRSGGTWDSIELVNDNDQQDGYQPAISLADADDVEALFNDEDDTDAAWRRRNASWGTQTQISHTAIPQIINDGILNVNETFYRYTIQATDLFENGVDTTLNLAGIGAARANPAYAGGERYLAISETGGALELYKNDGSWTAVEQIIGTGVFVLCENTFDQLSRDYVHGIFMTASGGDVYYWKWALRKRVYVISHG